YQEDGIALASIFNEAESPLPNPLTGGVDGFVKFYAEPGFYKVDNGSYVWDVDIGALEVASDALTAANAAVATAGDAFSAANDAVLIAEGSISASSSSFADMQSLLASGLDFDEGNILFTRSEGYSFQVVSSGGDY
ncbi:hypothetical protein, partial [Streptomyces tunisiensis]|uniref:hypothetical protein n=1 Tax=Streptomyces tunisiensis TaxID=948699 RepID=UPI00403D9786